MRRAGAVALILIALSACTNGSDDSSDSATTTAPRKGSDGKPAATWAEVEKEPCLLLSAKAVEKALDVDDAALVKGAPERSCRYRLDDGTTVVLDLYPAMTPDAVSSRTAGTTALEEGHLLRLDTPGSGVLVGDGTGLALVAVRPPTTADPERTATAAAALAAEVGAELPTAPKAAKGLLDRDVCDVVPASALGDGWDAADGGDPTTCAYRATDLTRILIRVAPDDAGIPVPGGGEPWPEAGKGATWHGVPGGAQSGLGVIPVDGGHVELTLSSPERGVSGMKAVALAASKAISAAAGD